MTSPLSRWRRTDDEPDRIEAGAHIRFRIRTVRPEPTVTGPSLTKGATIDELLGDEWGKEGEE